MCGTMWLPGLLAISHIVGSTAVRIQPDRIGDGEDQPIYTAFNFLTDRRSQSEGDEKEDWAFGRYENPAGCAKLSRTQFDLDGAKGVFAKEDFEEMLFATNNTNRLGGARECMEVNMKERWCPEPSHDSMGSIASEQLDAYIAKELEGTDTQKPLIVAVFQGKLKASAIGTQLANFLCGWERLGLLENRSAIFATSAGTADQVRELSPGARVLYHPGLEDAMEEMMKTTNLRRKNRIWKLGVAQLLLNLGRDVILSDMDVYFVRDPTAVFQEASSREGLEFAAMKSMCWLELNSGFLYYRNTPATKEMLRMALTTWRTSEGCHDNDQYLLNCGFARAAIKGLNYRILPPSDFVWAFGANVGGSVRCDRPLQQEAGTKPRWLGDGLPYVWHTGGFSSDYVEQLDMFAAFGMIDIDAATGKCKPGHRGEKGEAEGVIKLSAKGCSTEPGGITHAMCHGACRVNASKASAVVASFSTMLNKHGF